MARISILNFHFSFNNYGAVLQAYALQNLLKKYGHDPENINFLNFPRRPNLLLRTFFYTFVFPNVFNAFRKKYLNIGKERYYYSFQLKKYKEESDFYIVGSDQVWRCGISKTYFFDFLSTKAKKIAYSVSFGNNEWFSLSSKYSLEVGNLIRRFSALSVRESGGIQICKDIAGVDAVQTLDPILLAGKDIFSRFISPNRRIEHKKKIAVLYQLDDNKYFDNMIEVMRQKYSIRNLYKTRDKYMGVPYDTFVSVEEWINGIYNADIVITDSFHCICLCLLFHKEFLNFPNQFRGMPRIQGLLDMCQIQGRVITDDVQLDNIPSIDFDKVDEILESERVSSLSFLLNSLRS